MCVLLHIDRQICNWVSRKKAMTSIIRDGGRSENWGGRILSVHFYTIFAKYEISKMTGGTNSIANSSLFPTFMYLHSNSTQILALKKTGFFTFLGSKKKL